MNMEARANSISVYKFKRFAKIVSTRLKENVDM